MAHCPGETNGLTAVRSNRDPKQGKEMPLFYKFFAEEKTDDGTKKWVEFESVYLYSSWATVKATAIGKGTPGGDSLKTEALAGHTLVAIRQHKRFYVEITSDEIDMHGVHYLFAAIQQKWKLNMTIELVKYSDQSGGRPAGVTVVSEEFVAQVFNSIMRGQDAYAFNFTIIGGVSETNYDE
jgi:hypothetical protein